MGKSSKQKKRQQKAGKKEHPVAQKPKASPPPPAHASAPQPAKKTALSALQEKLLKKLSGGRFRQLNEDLYTSSGSANFARFSADPELADAYHRGFREQARGWPENPLDAIIAALASGPRRVVADFGCGDARLAAELNATHEVHSFDLVATAPGVVACNIERVPLAAASVDVAVFCLALMGPSHWAFLREAHRVLRPDGELRVTEVKSRFDDAKGGVAGFVAGARALGFDEVRRDAKNKMFVAFVFRKADRKPDAAKLAKVGFAFRACLYKKR
ncbi:ribosomal RNA processing protein 8 [Aureococcus anophagefferens]|uniref:Ribosomal RNA-processing protein 8 n=2 Tax=Aureococcus anophagefferens TaxID=44056 RepID=A0ABR1FII2_AURAN